DQGAIQPVRLPRELLDECERRGVVLGAYSPLGTGGHLPSDTVSSIAQRHGRTPAQVLLRCGSSATSRSSRSRRTASELPRTTVLRFSRSRTRKWDSLTSSTAREAPIARSSVLGGDAPDYPP